MYTPNTHPNIYKKGKRVVIRIVRNGKRYIKSYSTEAEAIGDYENFVSTIPVVKIFTIVRFTNTDASSPEYNMRYVYLGQSETPYFPSFGNTEGKEPPRSFTSDVVLSTPCWLTAKLRRDEEIIADYKLGLSYNRGGLIASPGVYYVVKSKGYVRSLDNKWFRNRNGVSQAKFHVETLVNRIRENATPSETAAPSV